MGMTRSLVFAYEGFLASVNASYMTAEQLAQAQVAADAWIANARFASE